MKFSVLIVPAVLAATALASPTPSIEKRVTKCGQWDSITTGTYTIYQDLWGKSSATSGSQCTTVNSDNGGTLSWSTSWSWAGCSYCVKSYANAVLNGGGGKQLSAIQSIPTTWHWR